MGLGVGLVALFAVASATDRPLAVLVTSERTGTAPYSAAIAKAVGDELKRAKAGSLMSEADSTQRLQSANAPKTKSCAGSRPCLLKVAAGLGSNAVLVAVDVGKLGSKLVIHVEGIGADGASLAVLDFTVAVSSYAVDASGPIVLFADSLTQKLRALDDAQTQPSRAELAPPPVEPPPQVSAPPEAQRSPILPIAMVGLGVVGAGLCAGFAIDGLQSKSTYDNSFLTNGLPFLGPDGRPASHLPSAQLDGLRTRGNTSFTVALISGIAGAALLAIGFWLFLSN